MELNRLEYNNEFIERRLGSVKDVIKFVDFLIMEMSFVFNSCLKKLYFMVIRINIKFHRISSERIRIKLRSHRLCYKYVSLVFFFFILCQRIYGWFW